MVGGERGSSQFAAEKGKLNGPPTTFVSFFTKRSSKITVLCIQMKPFAKLAVLWLNISGAWIEQQASEYERLFFRDLIGDARLHSSWIKTLQLVKSVQRSRASGFQPRVDFRSFNPSLFCPCLHRILPASFWLVSHGWIRKYYFDLTSLYYNHLIQLIRQLFADSIAQTSGLNRFLFVCFILPEK